MAVASVDAIYIRGTVGRLFCLLHAPPSGVGHRGSVVFYAPFADEMNKSRRMAALQARMLAQAGWSVLQPDMAGCGDSEGDFGAAGWDDWSRDAVLAADWMANRTGSQPTLWGLRAGCLLAAAVALEKPEFRHLLFWQPVSSGKQYLQQVLRLKVAGAMFSKGRQAGDGTRHFNELLQQGQSVEVGGYELSPTVALGLSGAMLAVPPGGGRMAWLEVSGTVGQEVSIAAQQSIGKWQTGGWQVDARVCPGPSFWQTQEIEESPALITDTMAHMMQAG